jgi:hypothetical protein
MLTTEQLSQVHDGYAQNFKRWDYLGRSYEGGFTYTQGGYLRKYLNEDSSPGDQYAQRLLSTALDNHVKSTIETYRAYLFKTEPSRIGEIFEREDIDEFTDDCDLDGTDLDQFMKNVNDTASIFGSAWILVDKPAYKAQTRAEEMALGIRPYVTMYTPSMVLDWHFERDITGRQVLTYVKIIEQTTPTYDIVKVWTPDRVESYKVSKEGYTIASRDTVAFSQGDVTMITAKYDKILSVEEYINPLGYIPMFCYQLGGTYWKGIGQSEVSDIADAQRMIYNLCSEMEQNIRISSHPSLVKSSDTDAAAGAGAVITLPEHMNGDLKPYLLQPTGATVDSILAAINYNIESINRMAHLSSVRGSVQSTRSGLAIEAEFLLLNAKLADRAHSLKDAEEKIWDLFFAWLGEPMPEDFDIEYETSFSLRDTQRELDQFKTALELVEDPVFKKHASKTIAQITLGEDDAIQEVWASIDSEGMAEDMSEEEYPTTSSEGCPPATQDIGINLANRQKAIDTANYGPLNPALPNTVFWMKKADMWNTDVATAKQSLCGNCSFFVETQAMLNCIEGGLAAGGATGNEWDSVGGGQLGYCEAFDFKCKSTRTCDAWVAGGPVTD